MNASPLTDQWLDRLVDGELVGDDYREVLARLELEPDGWRRCALAFLEAQAWKRDLFAPAREPAPAVLEPIAAKPPADTTNWSGLIVAMAASFLIAFGLGWRFGGRRESPVAPGGANVVQQKPTLPEQPKPANTNLAQPSPLQPSPAQPNDKETPVALTNQGEITLLVDDGSGEQQQVQLPVVEVSSAEDVARSLGTSALPARITEALERSGHRVVRQQQIIPVQLNDGRRLVMPVEEVRVMPIGGTYQ